MHFVPLKVIAVAVMSSGLKSSLFASTFPHAALVPIRYSETVHKARMETPSPASRGCVWSSAELVAQHTLIIKNNAAHGSNKRTKMRIKPWIPLVSEFDSKHS